MKINCAIVDDNIESVEILKSHVAKVPYLNLIGGYTNAVEAMKALENIPLICFSWVFVCSS